MRLRLVFSVVTALVLVLTAMGFLNLTVNSNRVAGASKTFVILEFPAKLYAKIDYVHNAKRVSEMETPPVHTLRYGQAIPWPKEYYSTGLIPFQVNTAIISCCFGECYKYPKLDKAMHVKVLGHN